MRCAGGYAQIERVLSFKFGRERQSDPQRFFFSAFVFNLNRYGAIAALRKANDIRGTGDQSAQRVPAGKRIDDYNKKKQCQSEQKIVAGKTAGRAECGQCRNGKQEPVGGYHHRGTEI